MNERKIRRSRQRDRILSALQGATDHPTASEVYDRLKPEFPSLSLGNVYRNLNILVEQGVVERIQSGSTFDRFEARKSAHFHFVCTSCGKIIDVDPPPQIHETLDRLVHAQIGRRPKWHRVEYYGVCAECEETS